MGDLKYGRDHTLPDFCSGQVWSEYSFCSRPGLEVPEHVLKKLTMEYGGDLERRGSPVLKEKDSSFPLDAIYITPNSPHQLH